MKVKRLIEILESHDPDEQVLIRKEGPLRECVPIEGVEGDKVSMPVNGSRQVNLVDVTIIYHF